VVSLPVVVLAAAATVVLAPLLFAFAAIIDLVSAPRRWRTTRLLALVVAALAIEVITLAAAGVLWTAFGCGRALRTRRSFWMHHRLQRWYTGSVMGAARVTCGLRIAIEDAEPASQGNAIVLGRHTSIGDAMIPAALFAGRFDLNTRYVLKDDLLWGPVFDIVGGRLRNHFVDRTPDDGDAERAALAELVHDLDDRSVAVIFPEGTFFTPERKTRAVQRLRDAGRTELAGRAEGLRHVLPPRPGGTLALLTAAPHADVVFVGHTGLERFTSLRAIWGSVPIDRPVRVWLWRVRHDEIPREADAQLRWLYDQWERLDASIHVRLESPSAPRPTASVAERGT
jgi:1-acyl-sn-glycerol-3-phosphate acyltransferase